MGWWKKAKPVVETVEHLHLGATLLDMVFDWRVLASGVGGAVVTLFTAAYDGRSVTDVLLAAVLGAGIFALLAAGIITLMRRIRSQATQAITPDDPQIEFARDIPDVRIADSPDALTLFDGVNGDKLIPLLESEKITSWGRPRGDGETPLLRVPGATWRTHRIELRPHGGVDKRINQTFLKRGGETYIYYDIRLNRAQLNRIWPNFEQVTISPVVPWPDFDKWDKRTDFRLFEIACLWADQEPGGFPLTAEASRCFKILEQAIWDERLTVRSDSVREAIANAKTIREGKEAKADPNWIIERRRLLLYASGTDQKPRFLFPKERV